MEKLLNKLIEKGWKPRGENVVRNSYWIEGNSICWNRGGKVSIRELVSKESGLWQFVCENGMVKEDDGHIARIINLYKSDEAIVDGGWNYHYWLMICSTLDESELEEFLLDNIKVE